MSLFGNGDSRRVRAVLERPRVPWVLEQWAKTEVLHAADAGVDLSTVFTELGPIRELVRDAHDGAIDRMAVRTGLTTLVRFGGWVPIGIWRLLHELGPADWLTDDEIRDWFVDGLRGVASTSGGRQFPYQPADDEEQFLRQRAGRQDPLWLFIPMRGKDLIARDVPAPNTEPRVDDLPIGQERQIAVMTSGPDSNIMFAVHRDNGFAAVIDAPSGNGDPTRSRFEMLTADTLPNLYRRIGETLSTSSSVAWAHTELLPYFPFERPTWRP